MKMKLFALTVLAALSMGSARADQDWGMHAPTESARFSVSYFSNYDEFFFFELNQTSKLQATASNNFNRNSSNNVDLYNFDTGEDMGSFNFGTTPTSAYFNNLAAGNYFYEVSGGNYGTQIGQVAFSSTMISAVPEPETYAILLAGLGLIGFISRRRKFL